jgi:hypothetical protein
MECHAQKYINFGLGCTKDAPVPIMSFITVMVVAEFMFATSGASLKIFTETWARGRRACHSTESTTTARTRLGIADGQQQKSRLGIALLSRF